MIILKASYRSKIACISNTTPMIMVTMIVTVTAMVLSVTAMTMMITISILKQGGREEEDSS